MTTLQSLMQLAQAAIAEREALRPSDVELATDYFREAFQEIAWFRSTGRLPKSARGLEALAIDIELDERF